MTGADLAGLVAPLRPRLDAPGFVPTSVPALAVSHARFAGEPVALVAAASPYAAADACELVRVDGDALPAIANVDAALDAAVPIHAEHRDNVLFARQHRHGDVDGAFAAAAVVVRERFTHARVSAAPLEPRGAIARWDGDALTMWTGSQVPHVFRAALAAAFGIALSQVRVIVPDTGGGFGQKMHVMQEDLAVAAIARRVRRPVKWIETRRENLAAASHAREGRVDIEAAADADGVVLALRARVYSDAGAYHVYPLTASLEAMGTAGILPGPYRIPAYAYDVVAVATNKPPLGAYRGVGMTMGAVVMERTLDLVAERLGLDPVEIRRRNLVPRDAYPFMPPPQASSTTAATIRRRSSWRWRVPDTTVSSTRATRRESAGGSSASASPATRSTPASGARRTAAAAWRTCRGTRRHHASTDESDQSGRVLSSPTDWVTNRRPSVSPGACWTSRERSSSAASGSSRTAPSPSVANSSICLPRFRTMKPARPSDVSSLGGALCGRSHPAREPFCELEDGLARNNVLARLTRCLHL